MSTLDERLAALRPTSAPTPPPIAELRERVTRQRRRRIAVGTTMAAGALLVVALVVALATRTSHESGLNTVDQPPTTVPVVTSAKLSATHVPAGFVEEGAAVVGQGLISGPSGPADTFRSGGPRNLDSLSYDGPGQLPGGQVITAGASTQADYPPSFMEQIRSSSHWNHVDLAGREVSYSRQQQKVVTYFAWFADRGVLVNVSANGLSQADFLRFVAGLRVDIPR
jgi:hypothetical protein